MPLKAANDKLSKLIETPDAIFLECCYKIILRRDIDQDGLFHYGGRLAEGENRLTVIGELLTSPEAATKGFDDRDHLLNAIREARQVSNRHFLLRKRSSPHGVRLPTVRDNKFDLQAAVTRYYERTEARDGLPSLFPGAAALQQANPHIEPAPVDQSTDQDIALLLRLAIIRDPSSYRRLYSHRQGRETLQSLRESPPTAVFIICPSFGKQCGIGEYARYLSKSYREAGYVVHDVRTTNELIAFPLNSLRNSFVLVNHGPGLFDGYNPELSEGESTVNLIQMLLYLQGAHGARPLVFMHSLLDCDNTIMFPRQQALLESGIPVATTIESAADVFDLIHFEHGMQPTATRSTYTSTSATRLRPRIGFFGFFQWGGKNFDALINASQAVYGKIVGAVATKDPHQLEKLREVLKEKNIECALGTGWHTDDDLAQRLADADYYYLPQHDTDHWNNSGTARFALNFERPLIVPPHAQFLDLRRYALFCEDHDVARLISHLRAENTFKTASSRAKIYGGLYAMSAYSPTLPAAAYNLSVEQRLSRFVPRNIFSGLSLFNCAKWVARNRIEYLAERTTEEVDTFDVGAPASELRASLIHSLSQRGILSQGVNAVEDIKYYWRHYSDSDFIFFTAVETIEGISRSICKVNGDFVFYKGLLDILNATCEAHYSVNMLTRALSFALSIKNDLTFAPPPEVTITQNGEGNDAIVENITRQNGLAFARTLEFSEHSEFCAFSHDNLFFLLLLNSEGFASTVPSLIARGSPNVAIDTELLVQFKNAPPSPSARLHLIISLAAKLGINLEGRFVFDFPIMGPVENGRHSYAIEELLIYDGDDFIINAFRCLCKRNPFAIEIFYYSDALDRLGKFELIKSILGNYCCSARVTNIAEAFDSSIFYASRIEAQAITAQLRNPWAGGWDRRNRYLETKRNNAREWLKFKALKDKWWDQASGDISRILRLYEAIQFRNISEASKSQHVIY